MTGKPACSVKIRQLCACIQTVHTRPTAHYLFIYLFKNSTQYKQYKIEDTIKAVEF